MPLVLTIVRQPEDADIAETRKLFDENGGTLGRAASNNWSLPDPSRFVSSHHASIRYDQGDFYLVDTSTNGVYVNSTTTALGTGNQVRLQQGDKLYLGEYEIHVEFEQSEAAPNMSADDFDQWLGPESTDTSASASEANDLLTPEQELLDPLAALDKASGSGQNEWQGASLADNAAVPEQAFTPPNPIPEPQQPLTGNANVGAGVIPDDWDIDDLLSGDEPATPEPPVNAGYSQPGGDALIPDEPLIPGDDDLASDFDALLEDPGEGIVEEPVNQAQVESDELDAFLGLDDSAPAFDEQPAVEPSPVPSEPILPEPTPVPDPVVPAAPEIPAPPVAEATPVPVPESLLEPSTPQAAPTPPPSAATCDQLIQSLGLDPENMSPETREHFQGVLADTLRETVSGMMKVLGARNAIKNEFRMNVTMIQPVENNPLKFSPNEDEALRNMFTSQSNAYLPGTAAIREGFQDVADHQVAVIAGMRAAFRSLLKRFDPDELQVRFDKQHQAGFLASKKGMYWDAYSEFYSDLSNNMDDAFQDLFGEDFAEAYEQQMARLEATRKK